MQIKTDPNTTESELHGEIAVTTVTTVIPAGILLARGVSRFFTALGLASLTEVTLANGRRADIVVLDSQGGIRIVEVKSSIEDFKSDRKWGDYLDFCDGLYFAVPDHFPHELIPDSCGLIIADNYHAMLLREPALNPLSAARRKTMLIRFARLSAMRLQRLVDPGLPEIGWSA